MNLLWDGIQIGFVLAIMTGPILFALVQTGVEEGLLAGLMVCLGIWISDFLFIGIVSYAMAYAINFDTEGAFSLYLGIAGGIVLLVFGLVTILSKPPPINFKQDKASRFSSWWSLWLKGFLINTINPFTVVFWFGIATTIIEENEVYWSSALLFFGGIMGVVILTDFLKVKFSHKIRKYLQAKHVLWLRRISGGALIIFGIAMIVRVMIGI